MKYDVISGHPPCITAIVILLLLLLCLVSEQAQNTISYDNKNMTKSAGKTWDSTRCILKAATIISGFVFVSTIFCPKSKMVAFSRAHSHTSTNATRRHEYFPRTEQTFSSARSFGVISWASFSRKNGPFCQRRAPSASQKALLKSKENFSRKWNQ